MATTSLPRVPNAADLERVIITLNQALDELDWLLNGFIDNKNIKARSITAEEIKALTITAGEIKANTITADRMNVQQLSAIAADLGKITAGIIIGALIKTAETGARIELAEDKMRTYNTFGNLNGIQWGNFSGYDFGDISLYSNGTLTALIARTLGEWYIHGIGTNSLHLGSPSESNVLAEGSWDFNGETGFNGNVFLAPSAARVGAYTQPNSTATTVPGLVADFNTLLSNLKNMGIIN